jgi:hypothetical protein
MLRNSLARRRELRLRKSFSSISLHDSPPNIGIKRPFEPVYSILSLSGVCHGCDPFQLETERVRIRFVPGGKSDMHG